MDFKESRGPSNRGVSAAYPAPPPRRKGPLIALVVGVFMFSMIFFSSSSAVTEVKEVAKSASHHIPGGEKLPSLSRYNPFRQAAHEPPTQKNSSSGDAKWFSDWRWLNPFSSTITLDDTRLVLPVMPERPPIYTYYDPDSSKDKKVQEEEAKLLLIWRRAWWAQGFKPVILGRAEAMKNPSYGTFMRIQDKIPFRSEMMRWLAWGHMGSGILANWLVLPMASRDDHDLSYLRRGEYPKDDEGIYKIKRYETFGNGIFWGSGKAIDSAISTILNEPHLDDKKTLLDAIADRRVFALEPKPTGIAFYETKALNDLYKQVAEKMNEAKAEGLALLGQLISRHLHATFLSAFPDGLDVLLTHPALTTLLVGPALELATALNECPPSPLPKSCPPNNPKCESCTIREIRYPSSLRNGTTTFTIGTIPHPFTLAVLLKGKNDLDVPYIRRKTDRDPWLEQSTEQALEYGLSGYARILNFKETIVSDAGQSRGIWHTAERDWVWDDLEWHFGFSIAGKNGTKLEIPQPKVDKHPRILDPFLEKMKQRPSEKDLLAQSNLISSCKEQLKRGREKPKKGKPDLRRVAEAWHLADTEAWRFVRAFEARARMERAQWEEEEKKFLGDKDDARM